jgi:hypothetical protein
MKKHAQMLSTTWEPIQTPPKIKDSRQSWFVKPAGSPKLIAVVDRLYDDSYRVYLGAEWVILPCESDTLLFIKGMLAQLLLTQKNSL